MPDPDEKIEVRCPTRLSYARTRRIGEAPFVVRDGRANAVIDIDSKACIEPPFKRQRGHFAGVYSWGFESSHFIPCEGMPAETNYYEHADTYWVDRTELVHDALVRAVPIALDQWDTRMAYVEWLGISTGPGHYGHMSGALYRLEVEALYKVSANIPARCNPKALQRFRAPLQPPPPPPLER